MHCCTTMLLYVDDIIINGNEASGITAFNTCLMRTFKMKDLGALIYFLGLISHTKGGIRIHQRKYAEDLLSLAHLTDSKITDTPSELNVKIHREEGSPLLDPTLNADFVVVF